MPLPGDYVTHKDPYEQQQASLYFLACISMRRLLNRVHHLLYAHDTGVAGDPHRFPKVVAELYQQLKDWRDVLPVPFSFTLDTAGVKDGTMTEAGGFLRLRYLACQSVIYRPYLWWALSCQDVEPKRHVGCKKCLDSLALLVLVLDDFCHSVLIDAWISSMS